MYPVFWWCDEPAMLWSGKFFIALCIKLLLTMLIRPNIVKNH